jgi:large subunit ribosomal protein L6
LLISIKMKRDLERVIEIPEGVEVSVSGKEIVVKGSGKEIKKTFYFGKVKVTVADKKVTLKAKGATRRESATIGTVWAHVKNMINGLSEEYVYKLEVCNAHFPMNVKAEGDKIIIKSFLGETVDRVARILPGADVKIEDNIVTVSSNDIEAAGQTAANMEKATRLTGRDRRIFQDGIFITEKCGRAI